MLGDRVAQALTVVGVTEERVRHWLGSCRCAERREKLNALHFWARATVRGKISHAKTHLERLLGLG